MNVFPFIEAKEAQEQGTVARSCVLLEVSGSAFYEWSDEQPSARELADDELGDQIQGIYDDSKGTCGWQIAA